MCCSVSAPESQKFHREVWPRGGEITQTQSLSTRPIQWLNYYNVGASSWSKPRAKQWRGTKEPHKRGKVKKARMCSEWRMTVRYQWKILRWPPRPPVRFSQRECCECERRKQISWEGERDLGQSDTILVLFFVKCVWYTPERKRLRHHADIAYWKQGRPRWQERPERDFSQQWCQTLVFGPC